MSRVVNIRIQELRKHGFKNFHEWNSFPENVYIGRANYYLNIPASKFANPYKICDFDRLLKFWINLICITIVATCVHD